MLDWTQYRTQLTARVKELAQLNPDTVKGYAQLSGAAPNKDVLGAKIRELIALGAAVTLRCDGCVAVHSADPGLGCHQGRLWHLLLTVGGLAARSNPALRL